jgi:uncharacterized protein YdeI (YjbR/CyaY-like superfamily)
VNEYPPFEVNSIEEWREWLHDHHADSVGVWCVRWKKGAGPLLSYSDLVDEAIAVGWVDSLPRSLDDTRSMLLFTPRKPKSSWSRVNKARVERLMSEGRMRPSGVAAVELARRTGTWTALDSVELLEEPQDLRESLDGIPTARGHWDDFPRSTKRAILEWISQAKAPETRNKRIELTVAEAEVGRRANQWRQPRTAGGAEG